jgi:predicted nuclease of restriction endonuclease-like (RecB) superfamily
MEMKKKQHQKSKTQLMTLKPGMPSISGLLVRDVRALIEHARGYVARSVDTTLAALYWQVGKRIQTEILKGKRADYGDKIVQTLSAQLLPDYGRGFGKRNLWSMVRFLEFFPDVKIVQTLSAQLTWSHFVELIYIKDDLKRNFYAEMCRIENWDVRTLRAKIDGMLFERTALSRKPEKVIRHELKKLKATNQLTPDLTFRDPYFLDFLGLRGAYQEKDLEQAILREMEFFILELGVGFAFLERQKRISLDGKDFYLDLLFFHRRLNRLVAIELKLHEFRPADKGQMELYLRWLEKYEKKPNEDDPIGLILCAGKSDEQIELLQLGKSGIRVAEYMTELPSRKILEKKLHQAIKLARARLKE